MNKNVKQAKQIAAERRAKLEQEAKQRQQENATRNVQLTKVYDECKKVLSDFHNVETIRGTLTHDNTTLRLGYHEFLSFSAAFQMQRVGKDDHWESALTINMHWFDENGADQWQSFGSVHFFEHEVIHKVSEIL